MTQFVKHRPNLAGGRVAVASQPVSYTHSCNFCFPPLLFLCFYCLYVSGFSKSDPNFYDSFLPFVICNEDDDGDEKGEGQILLSFDVKLHSSIYRPLVDGSMISLSRCNRFEIDIDTDLDRTRERERKE